MRMSGRGGNVRIIDDMRARRAGPPSCDNMLLERAAGRRCSNMRIIDNILLLQRLTCGR